MPGSELIGAEELQQLKEVIEQKTFFRYAGKKVKTFEEDCARFLNAKYALAVSSGTAAVLVALHSVGLRPGDEVIMPAFTFVATMEAVEQLGAIPVLVDIDDSLNIDPEKVLDAITTKTRAVIAVHMLGSPANLEYLGNICALHDLLLIEDSAQAFGATYNGQMVGTYGDAASYSFAFTKAITTGEGGLVATNNPSFYKRACHFHDHGHEHLPIYRGNDNRSHRGFNFRMDELSGAVGIAQLKKIDFIINKQKVIKCAIKKGLDDLNPVYRFHHDPVGETHDTLAFKFPTDEQAYHFAEALQKESLFQKILPCALRWHLLDNGKGAILKKHVAIPINLNMDYDQATRIIRKAYKAIGW